MPDEKPADQFDALLDTALRNYSAVEPDGYFERRLLARVRAAQISPRPFPWRVSICALAAATVAILMVLAFWPNVHRNYAAQRALVRTQVPHELSREPHAPAPAVLVTRAQPRQAARLRARHTQPVYSRRFPTPAPMTNEERLMLIYAREVENRKAPLPAPLGSNIEPMSVSKLQIPPLPSVDSSGVDHASN
jgi:hypothetical protein